MRKHGEKPGRVRPNNKPYLTVYQPRRKFELELRALLGKWRLPNIFYLMGHSPLSFRTSR
jgi:hypothetical protein